MTAVSQASSEDSVTILFSVDRKARLCNLSWPWAFLVDSKARLCNLSWPWEFLVFFFYPFQSTRSKRICLIGHNTMHGHAELCSTSDCIFDLRTKKSKHWPHLHLRTFEWQLTIGSPSLSITNTFGTRYDRLANELSYVMLFRNDNGVMLLWSSDTEQKG